MTDAAPNYGTDLVAALGALEEIKRTRTAKIDTRGGGNFAYTYADMADVLAAVRPVLAKHHFVLSTPVYGPPGEVHVLPILIHATGQQYAAPQALVFKVPDDPQRAGSAATYARRIASMGLLGIAAEDEDDDGQGAQDRAPSRKRKPPPPPADPPAPRKAVMKPEARQTAHAMALFTELGYGDRDDRLAKTSRILNRTITTWNEVDPAERTRVIDVLTVERDGDQHEEDSYG